MQHLSKTKPATLVVGGWYDTEDLYGPLYTYQTMSDNNKKDHVQLVMGPQYHGQWQSEQGGTELERLILVLIPVLGFKEMCCCHFKEHLKGADEANLTRATMFETGSNRWRHFEAWPPKDTSRETLYLADDEKSLSRKTIRVAAST